MARSPLPRFDLLDVDAYQAMAADFDSQSLKGMASPGRSLGTRRKLNH